MSAAVEQDWGIDPVPNRPVDGRKLKFNRPRGAGFRKHFMVLTTADRPFRRLARARPTRRTRVRRLERLYCVRSFSAGGVSRLMRWRACAQIEVVCAVRSAPPW